VTRVGTRTLLVHVPPRRFGFVVRRLQSLGATTTMRLELARVRRANIRIDLTR
jgi:hypothetical protein